MNRKKALKLGIEALNVWIKHFAVDANIHDVYGGDYPYAIKASQKRRELLGAIEELEKMKNEG
jgi:hypothetical protein